MSIKSLLFSVSEGRALIDQERLDLFGEDHRGESKMSCNGCRVLRKGCSKTCEIRSCLRWIDSPDAQANATLFLAKFFGRTDLLSLISAVPDHERPALFKSLLYEACGRTVNPVNGSTGLLAFGKWNVCEAAVETVLSGGVPVPIQGLTAALPGPIFEETLLPPNNGTCTEQIPPRLFYPSSLSAVKARECQPSDFGLDLLKDSTWEISSLDMEQPLHMPAWDTRINLKHHHMGSLIYEGAEPVLDSGCFPTRKHTPVNIK